MIYFLVILTSLHLALSFCLLPQGSYVIGSDCLSACCYPKSFREISIAAGLCTSVMKIAD